MESYYVFIIFLEMEETWRIAQEFQMPCEIGACESS